MDGLYVIRTSLSKTTLSAEQTVSAYKDLSQVEWAFRSLKSVDLQVRPIHHWKACAKWAKEDTVTAQVDNGAVLEFADTRKRIGQTWHGGSKG